jgi:hypothetical protein
MNIVHDYYLILIFLLLVIFYYLLHFLMDHLEMIAEIFYGDISEVLLHQFHIQEFVILNFMRYRSHLLFSRIFASQLAHLLDIENS